MSIYEIQYKPREYQKEIHNNKRWKVLVWHRWSWKTTAALGELLKRAMLKEWTYEFISPTYTQSKRNARPIIKKMIRWRTNTTINESELKITLPNRSVIYMLWSDNPDSLRWLDYHWVIFDEYSQQPWNIFWEIVRPRLSITNWRAIWIWTPKGYNQFYDLFMQWQGKDEWLCDLKTVNDTKVITEEELNNARDEMTHDEFEQELLCNFNAAIKWAYYAKEISTARTDGRIMKWLYDPMRMVYTAWDLGMRDSTTVIFAQFDGKNMNIIDFYENNNEWLEHYVKVLDQKNYRYSGHFFPHDVRQRARQTWVSDLVHMQQFLGSDKCFVVDNHKIYDGIRKARLIFPKICFDEDKCKDLLNALTQYTQERDNKKGMFKDNPLHNRTSHAADWFRYMCMSYENIIKRVTPKRNAMKRPVIVNPRTNKQIIPSIKARFSY